MTTRLKIIWDGDVKGLDQHRVSVDAFGVPIFRLLKLVRRIASNIVTKAIPSSERTLQGRYAEVARKMDIEIAGVEQGSGGLAFVIDYVPPPMDQGHLFGDLATRAAIEFCDSIEMESKGIPKDSNVRDWLYSLPSGLTSQKYQVEDETGKELHPPVIITNVQLAEKPQEMPHLAKNTGSVVALGFEPGKEEVRVKKDDGGTVTLFATSDQVLKAWQLRDARVRVMFVKSKNRRLLSIQNAEDEEFTPTDELVDKHIFQRWQVLLHRLAQ